MRETASGRLRSTNSASSRSTRYPTRASLRSRRASAARLPVIGAPVDLDYELLTRSQKVHNPALGKHHLATELHPQPAAAKRQLPQQLLAIRRRETVSVSAFSEERRA